VKCLTAIKRLLAIPISRATLEYTREKGRTYVKSVVSGLGAQSLVIGTMHRTIVLFK